MTRFIRGLALYVLVSISVAGMTLAQTPQGREGLEDEEAQEKVDAELEAEGALEAKEALEALAVARTGYFNIYRNREIAGEHCYFWQDLIPLGEYEAHGYYNNGAVLAVDMWGDDPLYDDLLIGPRFASRNGKDPGLTFYASARGLEVGWYGCEPSRVFNEDYSPCHICDGDVDEIYVDATVFAGDGSGVISSLRSPTKKGVFY